MSVSPSGNKALSRAQSEQSLAIPSMSIARSASVGDLRGPKNAQLDSYESPAQSSTCVSNNVERVTTVVGLAASFIPVGGDAIALGASLVNLAWNPSWSNLLDVGLDTVGVLPAVPALGTVRRASRIASCLEVAVDVKKGAKAAKAAKGVWEGWGWDWGSEEDASEDQAVPEVVVSSCVLSSSD